MKNKQTKTTITMEKINEEKDYISYSIYKHMRKFYFGINTKPLIDCVVKEYEKNGIKIDRDEIDKELWSKMYYLKYDIMESIF